MKQVLLYLGNSTSSSETIYHFLENENIVYTTVEDQDLNHKIEALFTEENKRGNISTKFPFNFILFKDMNKEEVFAFISKSQHLNLSHKAMLTENNIHWTLEALLKEIEEEQQYFLSYQTTMNLLKEANALDPKDYSEESYIHYRNAFLNAYIMSKNQKCDKATLDALNSEMLKTKANLIKL